MHAEALLAKHLVDHHRDEAAATLEDRPATETAALFDELAGESVARLVGRMAPAAAAAALALCERSRAAAVLAALPAESAVTLLRRLPSAERAGLLAGIGDGASAGLRRVLAYADGCAGAAMDPAVSTLPDDLVVDRALRRLRKDAARPAAYTYVVDRDRRLLGVVTPRELLQAERSRRLVDVATRPVVALRDGDPLAVVRAHHGWRSYHALPVTDDAGRVVGVVPYETMRRIEADHVEDRPADMMMFGATLGRAWIAMTASLLDGLAASWAAARSREVRHDS